MDEDIEKETFNQEELDETLRDLESAISEKINEIEEASGKENPRILIAPINTLNLLNNKKGIVFGDQASLENVNFGGDQAEDVSEDGNVIDSNCIVASEEQLCKWLEQHYEDFEMAFLLALAVFGQLPCTWVYEIAEDLFEMMEGEKEEADKSRISVPHHRRVKTVGAKVYKNYIYNHTGRVEEEFICFQSAEYAPRVLECVWNEFRYFRMQLVCWLENYISDVNYSKTIRAINALAMLLQHDFTYSERTVIKPLLNRNNDISDFAVAQILLQVHENEQFRENVEHLFLHWTKQGRIHVSLITLIMCASKNWPPNQVKPAIENYINEIIQPRVKGLDILYEYWIPYLYAIGNRRAIYFKMIVEVLYDKMMQYSARKDRDKQKIVGNIFWQLINIDDLESKIDVNRKAKHQDMIFVKMCLIKNEEAPKLHALWKYLWKNRDMHRETKKFLERYLFQYGGCSKDHINYLRQFLYSFQDTPSDKEEMEFFLQKISLRNSCPVRAAEKINQRSIGS